LSEELRPCALVRDQKPSLYVLAGVNGAGKSSIGGALLKQRQLPWYNPDTYARALVKDLGMLQSEANAKAWAMGMELLDKALAEKRRFAFETTLGGNTVREKLQSACASHKVRIWYCGLSSPELHLERVRFRASRGGHDIPEEKIFERWETSRANLVELLPQLTELGVFDNSTTANPGEPVPEPRRILHFKDGAVVYPAEAAALADTPAWAQAIVERALRVQGC